MVSTSGIRPLVFVDLGQDRHGQVRPVFGPSYMALGSPGGPTFKQEMA